MQNNDTIAAISTPYGTGGLGVIRISGTDAIAIADKVFVMAGKKTLSQARTHTIHYGRIVCVSTGDVIDEAMASVMRGPRSYTGEDVVEISAHGSVIGLRRILKEILSAGARLAEPGEFTKRAFLNGRMDLSRAEAVIDIINAQNNAALKNAVSQLEGSLFREIEKIREPLLYVSAQFSAIVDYPDDEIAELTAEELRKILKTSIDDCQKLLDTSHAGRVIKEGLLCVIAGKPNVGKSSLLNALSRSERAIVTEIEGTTRDILEEYVTIKGIPLRLIDTAGIRRTQDVVEKIGVSRSRDYISAAQLVLVMLDSSADITDEDREVLRLTEGKKRILLLNKADLGAKIKEQTVRGFAPDTPVLSISVVNGEGIDKLTETIEKMCSEYNLSLPSIALSNMRHIEALRAAHTVLLNALSTLDSGMPMDMCVIDINEAIAQLGQITGAAVSADIVDKIFSEFCVGK